MSTGRPRTRPSAVSALFLLAFVIASTVAGAQERADLPTVAVILGWEQRVPDDWLRAFTDGMQGRGWTEGKNVRYHVEYWGREAERFDALARRLSARKINAFFVTDTAVAAVRKAAPKTPLVCPDMFDPVAEGVTTSLAKPSGNVTGLSWQSVDSASKRLEMLKEVIPGLRRVGVLFDASDVGPRIEAEGLTRNARSTGVEIIKFEVRGESDFAAAVVAIRRVRPQALLVSQNPLTFIKNADIIGVARELAIPSIGEGPEFAEAGGLLSYGPVGIETYRHAAAHMDKILKGAEPSEVPIEQPTLFESIVNLKTAKAIGVKIPESIMVRATKVIR